MDDYLRSIALSDDSEEQLLQLREFKLICTVQLRVASEVITTTSQDRRLPPI